MSRTPLLLPKKVPFAEPAQQHLCTLQKGRKEGRKPDERKGGRKEGSTKGRKDGRKDSERKVGERKGGGTVKGRTTEC
jgi:hypothetical protein